MTKTSGLGDNFYIDGYDLSGDTNALDKISGGNAPIDVTGIDKSGYERLGGLRDGVIDWTALFNTAAGQAHPRLSLLPTTDIQVTYFRGTTLGNPTAAMIAKQIDYDPTRGQDGALMFKVNSVANAYGLEWGVSLTAGKRTDVAATNGTGVDLTTTSTAFGWQAYLHVFSVTGTSMTVTLQDSADNSTFANLTGGAFTAVTAGTVSAQRLAGGSSATVRRYVRAITTGTFNPGTFAVAFVPNATSVVF